MHLCCLMLLLLMLLLLVCFMVLCFMLVCFMLVCFIALLVCLPMDVFTHTDILTIEDTEIMPDIIQAVRKVRGCLRVSGGLGGLGGGW